ncbi:uncharacterized protein [Nicotiana tomentosiformis]|uniref:uncharacterized protein n=1 Tax=Nicotiana tomentosiformis TaxID=4098 RepID=UPI00388C7B8F
MHDFIMAEDSELWDVICDGPFVSMKTVGEGTITVPKIRKEYNDADKKAIEKNFRSAKEIWEALQTAYEGTTQVKQSKIDMLTTKYELFKMKKDESIQDMHTRFTSIINEIHSLGEVIPRNNKVNAITEAKDLQKLTIDKLIGNLKTYEMKRKKDLERREPKKEKNLVLKAAHIDFSSDESDMTYLTRKFQKMIRSLQNHTEKVAKRNQVPDRKLKRRDVADSMVKQPLADRRDSSGESEGEDDQGDTSMMVVDNESSEYESIFALMAKSDEEEDKEEDEVSFLDVQRNLKTYSKKKLMSLKNVLIDAYHSLINEKNALIEEVGNIEQERDDMVVFIVDLKEQVKEVTRENTLLKNQTKKWMDIPKGKEVASEAQLELESELKKVKTSLVVELEKNRQLQEELKKV